MPAAIVPNSIAPSRRFSACLERREKRSGESVLTSVRAECDGSELLLQERGGEGGALLAWHSPRALVAVHTKVTDESEAKQRASAGTDGSTVAAGAWTTDGGRGSG